MHRLAPPLHTVLLFHGLSILPLENFEELVLGCDAFAANASANPVCPCHFPGREAVPAGTVIQACCGHSVPAAALLSHRFACSMLRKMARAGRNAHTGEMPTAPIELRCSRSAPLRSPPSPADLGALALEGHRAVDGQAGGQQQHDGGAVDAARDLSHALQAGRGFLVAQHCVPLSTYVHTSAH